MKNILSILSIFSLMHISAKQNINKLDEDVVKKRHTKKQQALSYNKVCQFQYSKDLTDEQVKRYKKAALILGSRKSDQEIQQDYERRRKLCLFGFMLKFFNIS